MNNCKEYNFEVFLTDIVSEKKEMESKPVQLMLGLTNVCNLHCAFCPYCGFCMAKIEAAKSIPVDFLQELRPYLNAASYINPSGRGEPFIYKNIEDFINICRECDALSAMSITNNGTRINKIDSSLLEGVNIISFSIDSVETETFELLRFGAKLADVLHNVKMIREQLPNTVLQWNVVVNRLNIDQLFEIYRTAREIGINYISYNSIYGYEEDQVIQLLRLRNSDRVIVEEQLAQIYELNSDSAVEIFNVISWGFEDGEERDTQQIVSRLHSLKKIVPYLDFDKITYSTTESRNVNIEQRKLKKECEKKNKYRIPYCTNPFCVMLIQPDMSVDPCCAAFGAIDSVEEKKISDVWNGEKFQILRESMFDFGMLPDYCKKCKAFTRYDYIEDILNRWKMDDDFSYDKILIPPNYDPPNGVIKDAQLSEMIKMKIIKDSNKADINSKEYWNNRFADDWNLYSGKEQTQYFASLLTEIIPEWLVNEINDKSYDICDLGCAEGDALKIYKTRFVNSRICGEDFSEEAIKRAQIMYPDFAFKVSDILKPENENKYPVVICSNVVEHFRDTYDVLKNIFSRATKYVVIMIPYREELGQIDEHERVFFTKDIAISVEDWKLIYAKSVKCESVYYPYEQIMLVYSLNSRNAMLADLVENVDSDILKTIETKLRETENNLSELITVQADNYRLQQELDNVQQKYVALEKKETELLGQLQYAVSLLKQKDDYLSYIMDLCVMYKDRKIMKLYYLKNRFTQQFLGGQRSEKKAALKWFTQHFTKKNVYDKTCEIYNPWMNVYGRAAEAVALQQCPMISTGDNSQKELGNNIKEILKTEYSKQDIIILSVIDFDFRYQRPQHIAARFAQSGNRVFYVNANFTRQDAIYEKDNHLFVVDFKNDEINAIYPANDSNFVNWSKTKIDNLIYSQAIRDAIVIVDYPNWVSCAQYIREQYGFKIVTDYMDDYTGFLGTAEDFLKENCIRLLQGSDGIVASSDYLANIARKYAPLVKLNVIRNGTEVDHFHKAIELGNQRKERKVIGYYGAVSHWFAWEKVCAVAKAFEECDIIIVGEVTEYRDKLEKYKNIKLLGEKKYSELPKYLADFDVCLIPFDTSTDLIKATNPVKFYEYLSAGKKIVATEIPELAPFKDKFVYMTNDNAEFVKYVGWCLEGIDQLATHDECVAFAMDNSWDRRYEQFTEFCSVIIPKVSIIVLTYNNLKYNKNCIESILSKTAYASYELIVVDNASTDGTKEYLHELEQRQLKNVKIIFNDLNIGFAGGNNIGIKASSGDYVLLLNNDTIVTRGWITSMVKHLENNSSFGMCNPVTNSIGNESMIKVSYGDRTELDEFSYSYTISHMNEEYLDVDRLPLFATLIRKKVIEEVGLLDEAYRIGMFEDDDYTERVINAGYSIVIVEDAFVHHINNGSFKNLDDKEYKDIFDENKRRFETKWSKKWIMPKYRPGVSSECNSDKSNIV